MTDIQVAAAAQRLIDAAYNLGDTSKGFDCLSAIIEFYGNLGVKFPSEYEGFTLENYAAKWNAGEGREEFLDFLLEIGSEVDTHFERAGDLMVFEAGESVFPGIYLGSGNMLCAFEKGVMVLPFKFYQRSLIACRRLV